MLLGFFGVLGFDKCFQIAQVYFPESAVLIEPGIDGAERLGVEMVDAVAAFAVLPYQVSAAQQSKVLGDGRAGDGESASDFSRRLAAAAQQIKDGTAGRIGEGLEGHLRRICNRTVPHNA
jgi:hypothetical protein